MARFLDDRPIRSFTSDLLWLDDATIREQITNIGHTIAAPLAPNAKPSESLTFAVHGPWGMGKSSALQLIRSAAIEKAGPAAERLRFIDYSAPAYEAMRGSDPEQDKTARGVPVTLALRVIQSLAGKTDKERFPFIFRMFDEAAAQALQEVGTQPDMVRSPMMLQQLSTTLASIIDFDRIISTLMCTGPSGEPVDGKVIVVLIDDLDRCQPDFVWEVLNTVQQWSAIRNFFVTLAIDREHLRTAVESRPRVQQVNPDYALEKYIQHSISVPPMNLDRLQAYLSALTRESPELAAVLSAFGQNADLLHYGLAVQSPRSAKRCINTLSLAVGKYLNETGMGGGEPAVRQFIKEAILQYTWGEFFEDFYVPARELKSKQQNHRLYQTFISLEQICLEYASLTDEQRLRFELERLAKRMDDAAWGKIPERLARFLGLKPLFFDSSSKEAVRAPTFMEGLLHSTAAGLQVADEFDVLKLNALQFDIEQAVLTQDYDRASTLGREVIELVTANVAGVQGQAKQVSSAVGDVAAALSVQEIADPTVAVRLWGLALQFDAEPRVRVNNMQRFVAFIMMREMTALYPVAEEMLKNLATPPLDAVNPDMTRRLDSLYKLSRGGAAQITVNIDEIDLSDEGSVAQAMVILVAKKQADLMIALGKRSYEYSSDPDRAYRALRTLADALVQVSAPSSEHSELALDIYRFILARYMDISPEAQARKFDVEHNLATVLYGDDYDDEAGRLWYQLYRQDSDDRHVRRAYSTYLARAKRPDLASLVSRGEYLNEEILIPTRKQLPAMISRPSARWLLEKPWFAERREGA